MASMAELQPARNPEPPPDRIPLEEVYMRMAEELAKRSTCARLQVGTVITTPDLTQVLGIGYNGNARGLPNRCDATTPGACGFAPPPSLRFAQRHLPRASRRGG